MDRRFERGLLCLACAAPLLLSGCAPAPKMTMAESCRQLVAAVQVLPGRPSAAEIAQHYKTQSGTLKNLADSVADPLRDPALKLADAWGHLATEKLNDEQISELRGLDQIYSMCGVR